VLLACVALHDKTTSDAAFRKYLPVMQKAASDERNFVKKGVGWALVAVGSRSRRLNEAAAALALRLSASADATGRWVGKDALRKLTAPATQKGLARKS
jgi:3-methyladenine DNA glycosylase AlkD